MENNVTYNSGIGFGTLLFLVFLVLKLTNVIDWSWWWVTAPLWGGLAIWGCVGLIYILIVIIIAFVKALKKNKWKKKLLKK
jgi:xanthine/uracil permease